MKSFFIELFQYNHNYNQKTLPLLRDNEEKISEKLLKLHSHVVNVHSIWNSKITKSFINHKPWDIFPITELINNDKENFNTSISIIEGHDLDEKIGYAISSGKTFNNSVKDILFHAINHSSYHRGQIATELRQCTIDPIMTDWIFYKWENS